MKVKDLMVLAKREVGGRGIRSGGRPLDPGKPVLVLVDVVLSCQPELVQV